MPVKITEKSIEPVIKDLEAYFTELYWADILALLSDDQYRLNSYNALISAIRTGKVFYFNGVFTGRFSAAISRELRRFAEYDGRTKTWKGIAPPDISAAATVANDKGRKLNERIGHLISMIPETVDKALQDIEYSIFGPMLNADKQASDDLVNLGINLQMTPELSDRLVREYTQNQNLNIKNWTPDQIERLRSMIQVNAARGYSRKELEQMIAAEFETTMNKARFLARQETSLFLTTVRDERYQDAGIRIVKWSTAQDNRVVGNPGGLYPKPSAGHGNHWFMQGKFCSLSDPTIYADSLKDALAGKWKSKAAVGAGEEHAGKEFQCRCTYIPVLA